jgi:hypothetical protein
MRWQRACRAAVVIVCGWLALGVARAGECHSAEPLSLKSLARLSCPELEQLYRHAEPKPIPGGFARGRPIYCADKPLAGLRSALTGLVWRGKVLDAADQSLVNQWLGLRAIKARLYFGPSWLDGKPALIMDYCGTSHVWADVRDEVREVAPGLFLGAMFRRDPCGPKFQMFFALEAPACP